MLNAPPESTNTSTGALPSCSAANASAVLTTLPARSQSVGVLNSAPIIITTGSRGGGLLANHTGGRYTSSSRWWKFDAAAEMDTGTATPLTGITRLTCIAVTVARSV